MKVEIDDYTIIKLLNSLSDISDKFDVLSDEIDSFKSTLRDFSLEICEQIVFKKEDKK